MRSALAAPLAAGIVVLLAPPALAEPPAPALPSLPSALAADLSTQESANLATLTAGSGVRLDAFVQTAGGPKIVTLDAASTTQARQAASLLDAQPSVEVAGLAHPVHVDAGDKAGLGAAVAQNAVAQWDLAKINAPAARSLVASSLPGVTVAVLDTGVAANPQLTPYLVPGRNFSDSDGGSPTATVDRYFHGTHVAGTIGASIQAAGVQGVAAGVKIQPVKVLDDTGAGYTDAIASGILWAADHGADVINMSLGGPGNDPTLQSAIDYARSKGVVVVAAVGNDAAAGNPVDYPGASAGVIGVAATDQSDGWASFSEHGPQVDVAAPGVDIQSLYLDSGIRAASGTSMATPHVAAIAALLKAVDRSFTPDQVQTLVENTTVDLGTPGRDDFFGRGRVDALAAVNAGLALAGRPTSTPIDALYQSLGGASGVLGAATSGEYPVAGGTARDYASGRIFLAPGSTTAHYSSGAVDERYLAQGGPGGSLGFPIGNLSGAMRGGGRGQHFRGGTIYWSPATGAHAVSGAIRDRWAAWGWEAGSLGYPTSDLICGMRGGGCGQVFQGGTVYSSGSAGTHVVSGPIRLAWWGYGAEAGGLGYPTTDLICGMRGGGCGQHFQGGTIFWSPSSGARLLSWISQDVWGRAGYEAGSLGYPTTDASCGMRGGGCGQHFQGGTVYWSGASGAHVVRGAIGDQWARLGLERGRLGYPTSEQYGVKGGTAQDFQKGTLTLKATRLTVTYRR